MVKLYIVINKPPAEHVGIVRQSANDLDDNTDLGNLMVTVRVDQLPYYLIKEASESGKRVAKKLYSKNKLISVIMPLQATGCVVGNNDNWIEGKKWRGLLTTK